MTDSELQRSEAEYPFPEKEIARLAQRRKILRFARPLGIGAEVGVFRGHFSAVLVEALMPEKIYLIDPWTRQGEFFNLPVGATPFTNFGKLPTQVAKREAELRTKRHQDVDVRIIEGYFAEEADKIEEKLDWIYIDGDHSYEGVLKDLHTAMRLLKRDGVILGDDWRPNPDARLHGVFRAVQEFTRTSNYQIIAAAVAGQYCLALGPDYAARSKA